MNTNWTQEDIPDLTGKVAIVTGANSGIGFETAKVLAAKGAQTILACRNMEKAQAALDEIQAEMPDALAEILELDLASQSSVHNFVETFKAKSNRLDILVNNAGIMMVPYGRTEDGFERQFGTNHLGHFALTGLLFDMIQSTAGARIVNVSSGAHRMGSGAIAFDNLDGEKGYNPTSAYAQSKLANLLFTRALNQQFKENGIPAIAASAHPGWTATGLQRGLLRTITRVIGQSPAMGALPSLYAATAPDVQPNDYYGPGSFMEIRGHPQKVGMSAAAKDAKLARNLWAVSEELTGVHFKGNGNL